MNAWADPRHEEAALRRRIEDAGHFVSQLLPTPEGPWICELTQEDTGLRRAWTGEDRQEAIEAAARGAEGRS